MEAACTHRQPGYLWLKIWKLTPGLSTYNHLILQVKILNILTSCIFGFMFSTPLSKSITYLDGTKQKTQQVKAHHLPSVPWPHQKAIPNWQRQESYLHTTNPENIAYIKIVTNTSIPKSCVIPEFSTQACVGPPMCLHYATALKGTTQSLHFPVAPWSGRAEAEA